MADTLVGTGYDSLVGTRQSTVNPTVTEFYNKQSGQGFTDPNALSSFVNQNFQGTNTSSQNVFDVLKGQYTPVKVDVSPVVNSSQLAQPPKTAFDVQSLLAENRKLQEQYLAALQPNQQEIDLQNQLNTLQNQARSTQLNAQAGLNQIEDQAIPMQFITGQQAGLQRQANLALQTNAFQQQPLVQQLQLASQLRQSQQERYNSLLQFGRDDLALALQMEQSKKQEQAQAKQLALEYGVTKPFYEVGGTVYRTSDGKAYSSIQQAKEDGVDTQTWGNVQKVEPQQEAATSDIAEYQFAVKQGFGGSFLDYLSQKTRATTRISGGGGGSIATPLVNDVATDNAVIDIIRRNPGEYGNAADEIDATFGKGTATLYDDWLRRVYLYGQNINEVVSNKPPTNAETVAAGYANRTITSNEQLTSLENAISKYNRAGFDLQMRDTAARFNLRTPIVQQYDQAARNFINAVLRRESGAVISKEEFENAYQQYLPRPGDSAEVLAQKALNRQETIKGLTLSAGNAFTPPSQSNVQTDYVNNQPYSGTTSSGLGYTIIP